MNQIKIFFLNGRKYYTFHYVNISNIIDYFNYSNSFFILEYNNLICTRNDWSKIFITNFDKIEIITIVGGG